jgi:hypothetical protein
MALIFHLAYMDSRTSANVIVHRTQMELAFDAIYGGYGWNVLVRFPELRLITDLIGNRLAPYLSNKGDSSEVVLLLACASGL